MWNSAAGKTFNHLLPFAVLGLFTWDDFGLSNKIAGSSQVCHFSAAARGEEDGLDRCKNDCVGATKPSCCACSTLLVSHPGL